MWRCAHAGQRCAVALAGIAKEDAPRGAWLTATGHTRPGVPTGLPLAEAEAKAAEDAGLVWVGETTGAAQARGTLLIAAADRRKSDPSGRTINQLMKLAPK